MPLPYFHDLGRVGANSSSSSSSNSSMLLGQQCSLDSRRSRWMHCGCHSHNAMHVKVQLSSYQRRGPCSCSAGSQPDYGSTASSDRWSSHREAVYQRNKISSSSGDSSSSSSSSRSSRSKSSGIYGHRWSGSPAGDPSWEVFDPRHLTYWIKTAGTVPELNCVVSTNVQQLNSIHITAAFRRLSQLHTQSAPSQAAHGGHALGLHVVGSSPGMGHALRREWSQSASFIERKLRSESARPYPPFDVELEAAVVEQVGGSGGGYGHTGSSGFGVGQGSGPAASIEGVAASRKSGMVLIDGAAPWGEASIGLAHLSDAGMGASDEAHERDTGTSSSDEGEASIKIPGSIAMESSTTAGGAAASAHGGADLCHVEGTGAEVGLDQAGFRIGERSKAASDASCLGTVAEDVAFGGDEGDDVARRDPLELMHDADADREEEEDLWETYQEGGWATSLAAPSASEVTPTAAGTRSTSPAPDSAPRNNDSLALHASPKGLHPAATTGRGLEDGDARSSLLSLLRRVALEQLPSSGDVRSLSNTMHALAHLGTRDEELISMLLTTSQTCLDKFTPQQLSIMLWSLGCLKYTPSMAWLGACLSASLTGLHQHPDSFTMQSVANMMWSQARLGLRPPASWISAFLSHAQGLLTSDLIRPQELANLLWALGRFGYRPPSSWMSQAEQLSGRSDVMACFSMSELASLMGSLAGLGWIPRPLWQQAYQEAVMQQLYIATGAFAREMTEILRANTIMVGWHEKGHGPGYVPTKSIMAPALSTQSQSPAQEISKGALAEQSSGNGEAKEEEHSDQQHEQQYVSRWNGPPPLLQAFLSAASTPQALQVFTTRELVSLLWSMSKLRYRPDDIWMQQCLAVIWPRLPGADSQELSNLVYSLAKLHCKPTDEWLEVFLSASMYKFNTFSPQHLANTLWGLTEMGVLPNGLWLASFSEEASRKLLQFNAIELRQLRHCVRGINVRLGGRRSPLNSLVLALNLLSQQDRLSSIL